MPLVHAILLLICALLPAAAQTQRGVSQSEVDRWNRVLTSPKPQFNTNPNQFLVEMAKGRTPGAALDVGMGQGRNAIWLAQQGWNVTGFDPAADAVMLARRNAEKLGLKLTTRVTGMEDFDFGERRWDLILLSYVPARPVFDRLPAALKLGGLLVIEAFHREAAQTSRIGGGVLFGSGELPKAFPTLEVVKYEEPVGQADFGGKRVRIVRYCGKRVK